MTASDDIKQAAGQLTNAVTSGGLGFIDKKIGAAMVAGVLDFHDPLSRLSDYDNYQSTLPCLPPSQYSATDLYKYVGPILETLEGVSGFMQDNFMPFYDAILNNQDLVTFDTLYWWDYQFNSTALLTGTIQYNNGTSKTISISFIDFVNALKTFGNLQTQMCPSDIGYIRFIGSIFMRYFYPWNWQPGDPGQNGRSQWYTTLSDANELTEIASSSNQSS